MLTKITLPFRSGAGLRYGYRTASLFHGLLMELIAPDYAVSLHENALHPFSLHLDQAENGGILTVSALTAEAAEQIMPPLRALKTAYLSQKDDELTFGEPTEQSVSYHELFRRHYIHEDAARLIALDFTAPTAFKSAGQYVNMPTARLILSGLAKRYDATCDIHDTVYDTLFDEIEQRVTVSAFRIRSVSFPMEGVRIPAFMGQITLKIAGNQTFRSYVNMLCEYAQYAGIGIKTGLGMGAVNAEPVIRNGGIVTNES